MRRILIVAFAVLATATPASAATVTLTYQRTSTAVAGDRYDPYVPPTDVYEMRVADPDGAADAWEVDPAGRVRALGPRALDVGPGCSADAVGWVACAGAPTAPGNATAVTLQLSPGAGDDRLTGTGRLAGISTVQVDLGLGDDVVDAHGVGWSVRGDEGADRLTAGPAAPAVQVVWDGGPGPDSVSGSAALVNYASATAGVRATPDGVPDDGAPGEGDDVGADVGAIVGGEGDDTLQAANGPVEGGAGADTLLGGRGAGRNLKGEGGDDTILGGAQDEVLDGGAGDDVLDGGDGDDMLDDGAGADRINGGAGDDDLERQPDGASDALSGGPGRDRLFELAFNSAPSITLGGRTSDDGDRVADDWEDARLDGPGRLIGSDRAEHLELPSWGTADGRGGDDVITGWGRLVGGPGHDVVTADIDPRDVRHLRPPEVDVRDGAPGDQVFCVAPKVVLERDPGDRTVGCAGHPVVRLHAPASADGGPLVLRGGARVRLGLDCYGPSPCRGTVFLRAGGARVGHASFRVFQTGHGLTVPVRLGRPAAPCGTARASVRLRDAKGRRFVQDLRLGPCAWG
jgi:Ca2+-binding RTX toxin-like protein